MSWPSTSDKGIEESSNTSHEERVAAADYVEERDDWVGDDLGTRVDWSEGVEVYFDAHVVDDSTGEQIGVGVATELSKD